VGACGALALQQRGVLAAGPAAPRGLTDGPEGSDRKAPAGAWGQVVLTPRAQQPHHGSLGSGQTEGHRPYARRQGGGASSFESNCKNKSTVSGCYDGICDPTVQQGLEKQL